MRRLVAAVAAVLEAHARRIRNTVGAAELVAYGRGYLDGIDAHESRTTTLIDWKETPA